ncbi:MAG: hypothetical protein N2169_06155 [bacterium]|nr:hypothetical protein [bacterium]
MGILTRRGIGLKNKIEGLIDELEVLEVFPGVFYDVMKLKRKDKILDFLGDSQSQLG